jgi:16S rRNA (guanine(966)-N(2))-methyltransferase RsmD
MRIIAGEFRGRRLLAPRTDATRPVTDRVKQSLFDILAPLIPDAVVYDCFAGTGSMGLECLSRGARRVVFFEADRSAATLLRKNIATLDVDDRSLVISSNVFPWFAAPRADPNVAADLIFLDPPYRFLRERPDELRRLSEQIARDHLTGGGTVIFRHAAYDELHLPGLERVDIRTYGEMTLQFLRLPAAGTISAELS